MRNVGNAIELVRSRRFFSSVLVVVLLAPVIVAAVQSDGFEETHVDLNDAGVWVTNTGIGSLGRVNTQIAMVEVQVAAGDVDEFDVAQQGSTVLLSVPATDAEADAVHVVDVATGLLAARVQVPLQSSVQIGGDTVAVLDPLAGELWRYGVDALAGAALDEDIPTHSAGRGAVFAQGVDGATHLVSLESGELLTFDTVEEPDVVQLDRQLDAAAVTSVGGEAVVLDPSGAVRTQGAGWIALDGHGTEFALQQPGPARGSVLVATDSALLAVDLASGDVEVLTDEGSGAPVEPVALGGCVYGAWSSSPRTAQICGPDHVDVRGLDGVAPGASLTFRVNRDRVVLNETATGFSLLFTDDEPVAIEDWTESGDLEDTDEPSDDSVAIEVELECDGERNEPVLNAVSGSTRAGRPVIVRVLDNDDIDRCDVPVITLTDPPDGAEASAAVVDNGTAVQVTPAPGFVGTVRFGYGVVVGSGTPPEATVEVTVRDSEDNQPPIARSDTAQVGTGRSVTTNVLANDLDPDGDALTLTGASLDPDGAPGTVTYRANGEVTFQASGLPGTAVILYEIEDEFGLAADEPGELAIDVIDAYQMDPIALDDRVDAVVGHEVTLNLLDNDVDPDGGDLRLSELGGIPSDISIVSRESDGRVTLVAEGEGSFLFSYAVTDGQGTAEGRVRVTATDPEGNRPPVAVRDDLAARPGVPAVIDLVRNDIDPDGDVLAVTSVEVEDDAPLSVELIDRHIARVVPSPGFDSPATVRYVVTDGLAESEGVLVVRPLPSDGMNQPPRAEPDSASLRAGTATRIPVLENDVDPEGEQLSLLDHDEQPFAAQLGPDDGFLYVYGDELRYEAPASVERRRSIRTSYSVQDPAGNVSSAAVTIEVLPDDPEQNRAPVPPPIEARVVAGDETSITIPIVGIDPDGDAVAITGIQESASLGVARLVDNGVLFTAFDGASGPDSFTYRVVDEYGAAATGEVSLAVLDRPSRNRPPMAVPDDAEVQVGDEVSIPVLFNDVDPDGDPLSLMTGPVDGPTQPSIGEVLIDPEDSTRVLYRAPEGIDGDEQQVSFTYGVTDGRGGAARGVVSVTVTTEIPDNRRPVAVDDFHRPVARGDTVLVDVLANDYDPDGPDSELVLTDVSGEGTRITTNGLLEVVAERSRVVRYEVTDQNGEGASAWALVVVPVVDETMPSCEIQRVEATPGETIRVSVLDGCVDPAGEELRVVDIVRLRNGEARLDDDVIEFTLDIGATRQGGAVFVVESESERRTVGGLLVDISGDGPPPEMATTEIQVSAGGERTVDLLALVDRHGRTGDMVFAVVDGATGGISARIDGAQLVVAADQAARGETTELTIGLSEGPHEVEAVFPVVVSAFDGPPPVAVDDTATTTQGRPVVVPVTANDSDPVGDGLTVSVAAPPPGRVGSVDVQPDGSIEFTPHPDFSGTAEFEYSIADATDDPDRTSRARVSIAVVGYPLAPAAPTGDIASQVVDLRWGAPSAQGAPISRYVVERRVEGSGSVTRINTANASTTYQDRDVVNGTRYEYRVLAVNEAVIDAGDEQNWSPWSEPLQPDQVPDAPDAPTLVFGDRSVDVQWEPPYNEGSAIVSYEIRVSGGFGQRPPVEVPAGRSSYRWEGLSNGTDYTFSVRARNDAEMNGGWGEWSQAASESPAGAPLAISNFTANRLDENTTVGGAVEVRWSTPTPEQINADELDGFVLRWWRTSAPGTTVGTREATPSTTREAVYNLENGVDYTFEIVGVNKAGNGQATTSAPVRPAGVPLQMSTPGATPSAHNNGERANVNGAMPNDNGSPINRVEYQVTGGQHGGGSGWRNTQVGTAGGQGSSFTFEARPELGIPLTNGTSYRVRLRACNELGCGAPSPESPAFTPYGQPRAPGAPSASRSGNTMTWTWPAADLNGGQFVHYQVSHNNGGWQNRSGTSFEHSVACGQTHSIRVRAVNTGPAGNKVGEIRQSGIQTTEPCQSVTITWGDPVTCDSGGSCRWLRVELVGIGPPYAAQCQSRTIGTTGWSTWWNSSLNDQSRVCHWGVSNTEVRIVVNGVASAPLRTWN